MPSWPASGAERNGSGPLREKVERAPCNIEILPFPPGASHKYGILRPTLERVGQATGADDMLIAAHALALGAILVTDDSPEFARMRNLQIENWLRWTA